ncbi:MAG TPA: hypothetical protein VKN35_14425, partial [Xanthomonadales bacterium]|nr:hypothetical protein [Xanthomonadales bacterium]
MTLLLASSVFHGSMEGESHGALHLVDMTGGRVAHVVDWKAPGVDWNEQGGGRGLRGIAIDDERVFVASANKLHVFSPEFELLETYRSPYLADCHEICGFENRLYLSSTAFDSVLGFDLEKKQFDWGLHVVDGESGPSATPFDPQSAAGPPPVQSLGLNSLWCDPRGMFLSGSRTSGLLYFDAKRIEELVTLPRAVQNARPWRDGVLFNDSESRVARFITPASNRVFQVPTYPDAADEGEGSSCVGFARGLCVVDESVFAVGSSPATITLHDL